MSLSDPAPARRNKWPRSQRFALSPLGETAEQDYRATIVASRAHEGRASYDEARALWAARFRLKEDDGLYLCELRVGAKTMEELVRALESCDKTRKDAIDAIDRIYDAGLAIPDGAEVRTA